MVPARDGAAEAASKTVDAASEAIAYESGYEGSILEPEDVGEVIVELTSDIREAPVTALAIASSGLSAASSLLGEADFGATPIGAAPVSARRQPGRTTQMTIPLGFYGL